MPRIVATSLVAGIVVVAALAIRAGAPEAVKLGSTPVVVELFTSQGCSSCPPADELLRQLARDPEYGRAIIPLAYHVDYWDYLGWRDPFSSKQFTIRQMTYVRALGLSSAYTPQVVIAGSREMVGSHAAALRAAIAEASNRRPEGSVRISLAGDKADVRAEGPAGRDLIVVAFEDGATTQVTRGENAGRTIANDSIVRQITRAGGVEASLALPPGATGVVAFLQDRKTMHISAAAVARRPAGGTSNAASRP